MRTLSNLTSGTGIWSLSRYFITKVVYKNVAENSTGWKIKAYCGKNFRAFGITDVKQWHLWVTIAVVCGVRQAFHRLSQKRTTRKQKSIYFCSWRYNNPTHSQHQIKRRDQVYPISRHLYGAILSDKSLINLHKVYLERTKRAVETIQICAC